MKEYSDWPEGTRHKAPKGVKTSVNILLPNFENGGDIGEPEGNRPPGPGVSEQGFESHEPTNK